MFSEGFDGNLTFSSNSTKLVQRLVFAISTGSYVWTEQLAQVQFALIQSLSAFCGTITALTWNDKPFVTHVRLITNEDGLIDPALNRGIKGWSCILRFEVDMHFARADLTPTPVSS